MMLNREDLFMRIQAMLATLAGKDINDSEVIACTNAIIDLYEQNINAGDHSVASG